MTNKQKTFLNIAKDISLLGDYPRANVGAVVTENNRIISTGYNSNKTSPVQMRYNKFRGLTNCIHRKHAEIDALTPLINNNSINWKHVTIYVYRETKDGIVTCARPCPACMQLIKDLNIREIYYTNWNGTIEKEEIT